MADAPSRAGGLLGDRYVLEGLIGRGGMADVYRAHDPVLCRPVAVKLLRSVTRTESERARFTNEALTLARLSHPGLVTILDAATRDDEPYLVMELIDGPSLAVCCRKGALEPARAAAIGAQLADALGHVHNAGVVHRDLKPGNVLLEGADDRAKLADFGIARLLSDTTRHTDTGVTVGTAAYLAPEQVRGQEVTPAADVYSLGLVLLEALTGERAYRGSPVEAALARLVTPPAIPDTLPLPWHGLLRAMTALDPAARPSPDEAATSLRALASQPDPATATRPLWAGEPRGRETALEPIHAMRADADRPAGNRRWVVGALCAALLLAPVGVAITGQHESRGSNRSVTAATGSTTATRSGDQGESDLEHAEHILVPDRTAQPDRRPPQRDQTTDGDSDGESPGDLPVVSHVEQAAGTPHNDVEKPRGQQAPRKQSGKRTRKEQKKAARKAPAATVAAVSHEPGPPRSR